MVCTLQVSNWYNRQNRKVTKIKEQPWREQSKGRPFHWREFHLSSTHIPTLHTLQGALQRGEHTGELPCNPLAIVEESAGRGEGWEKAANNTWWGTQETGFSGILSWGNLACNITVCCMPDDLGMDMIDTIIRHLLSWTVLCSGTVSLRWGLGLFIATCPVCMRWASIFTMSLSNGLKL